MKEENHLQILFLTEFLKENWFLNLHQIINSLYISTIGIISG